MMKSKIGNKNMKASKIYDAVWVGIHILALVILFFGILFGLCSWFPGEPFSKPIDLHLNIEATEESMRDAPSATEENHFSDLQEKMNNGTATEEEKAEASQFILDWMVKGEDTQKQHEPRLATENDRSYSRDNDRGTYTRDSMDREPAGRDS